MCSSSKVILLFKGAPPAVLSTPRHHVLITILFVASAFVIPQNCGTIGLPRNPRYGIMAGPSCPLLAGALPRLSSILDFFPPVSTNLATENIAGVALVESRTVIQKDFWSQRRHGTPHHWLHATILSN
jgi:hypothetical protein